MTNYIKLKSSSNKASKLFIDINERTKSIVIIQRLFHKPNACRDGLCVIRETKNYILAENYIHIKASTLNKVLQFIANNSSTELLKELEFK